MTELDALCAAGDSLYRRGYAHGSTGNLSVRMGERVFITATGGRLEGLRPDALAEIDLEGRARGAHQPSKEAPFHLAVYRRRPEARAIVHLHSTYAVALSCLEEVDLERAPLTPYFHMRVAPLGVVPYLRPGSEALAAAIDAVAGAHACLLLRNHGGLCSGGTVSEALDRAEELEASARLHFILRGEKVQTLTAADVAELRRK